MVESTDTFEVQSGITSYDPTIGSTAGGTVVVIQGSGFTIDQTDSVSMGGPNTYCDSTGLDESYHTLTC